MTIINSQESSAELPVLLLPVLLLIFLALPLHGQFSPAAGQTGSKAIHKDDPRFVSWAKGCVVIRGPMDISRQTPGLASYGDCSDVIGKAAEAGSMSLGDGGIAILSFDPPITNGPGYDFAVFENAFNDYFLELAFVEVSSDGNNFVRFPATSLTQTQQQVGTFGTLDPTKIHNLAGKFRAHYGTPFDLEELSGIHGLDINHISHVRIVDVVGSIMEEYASRDAFGNMVNDPWPTPFPSGGFDLDAVGVIHALMPDQESISIEINPNPSRPGGSIRLFFPYSGKAHIRIIDSKGQTVFSRNPDIASPSYYHLYTGEMDLGTGVYHIIAFSGKQKASSKWMYFAK